MDFPIVDLMDPGACYQFLMTVLHPDGFRCPRCDRDDRMGVQARHREPVLDYRCAHCGRVFNVFTGTLLAGNRRPPAQVVLILRGIAQGTPTAQLARELGCDRKHLLALRHRLQEHAADAAQQQDPVPGSATEADEMFQNAGEKRDPAPGPRGPAPATGQQATGARNLRQRPPARRRGGRSGDRSHRSGGGGAHGPRAPDRVRDRAHGTGCGGVHG